MLSVTSVYSECGRRNRSLSVTNPVLDSYGPRTICVVLKCRVAFVLELSKHPREHNEERRIVTIFVVGLTSIWCKVARVERVQG